MGKTNTPTQRGRPEVANRYMAKVDGPVVAFLIGMRINSFFRVWEWMPVFLAMPKMLMELGRHPELGALGARTYLSGRVIMVVQYWRSFDQLERYARATENAHLPAWKAFNTRARRGHGAVGIFHETYAVAPGQVESVYVDMPAGFGLAGAVGPIDVRTGPAGGTRAAPHGPEVGRAGEVPSS